MCSILLKSCLNGWKRGVDVPGKRNAVNKGAHDESEASPATKELEQQSKMDRSLPGVFSQEGAGGRAPGTQGVNFTLLPGRRGSAPRKRANQERISEKRDPALEESGDAPPGGRGFPEPPSGTGHGGHAAPMAAAEGSDEGRRADDRVRVCVHAQYC